MGYFENLLAKARNLLTSSALFEVSLVISPAIFLAYLLLKYSVNVPLLDEWVIARLLPQIVEGSATFQDFIGQFNEHRILFPRLIIAGLAFLTHWDIRYEMLCAFALASLISYNLLRLHQLTTCSLELKNSDNHLIWLIFLTNLLIFSPAQWENWLVGLYLKYFIPIACLTTGIVFSYGRRSMRIKVLWCSLLATISTYAIANGMLCWLLLFPLIFPNLSAIAKNWGLASYWWLAFCLNLFYYFWGYRSPYANFSWLYPLSHPIAVLHYFLAFLGSPLAFGGFFPPLAIATLIGAILIILFLSVCCYIWRHSHLWRKSLGWIAIALYAMGSDLVVAVGRIYSGVDQALTSRYATFAVYLMIALLALLTMAIADWQESRPEAQVNKPKWLAQLATFTVTILLLFHCQTTVVAAQTMQQLRITRLQGKACLQAINLIPTDECIRTKINPKPLMVRERGNRLNQFGFLQPPFLTSKILNNDQQQNHDYGWFDKLQRVNEHSFIASGWAILPHRQEPADAVFLTYENDSGQEILFKIADERTPRPDVAKSLGKSEYMDAGWQKSFSLSELPIAVPSDFEGFSRKIGAWAFDTDTGKAFRLNQNLPLGNP